MKSLLAFWMGGAACTVIEPTPARNIFRLDQSAAGSNLFGTAAPASSGQIFRGESPAGTGKIFR